MKRINLKSISEPLSGREMRVITGGDQKPISGGGGDGLCCYYKCGGPPYREGVTEKSQTDCFNWMMVDCPSSFTVQPCPW